MLDKCSVTYIKTLRDINNKKIFIELSPKLHSYVADNNYYLYIGHQRCKAYDHLNVNICYKCGHFNHNGKKCDKDSIIFH